MKFVFKTSILWSLFFCSFSSISQEENITLWKNQLEETIDPSKKLVLYDSLIWNSLQVNESNTLYYELEAIQLAADSKNDSTIINTYIRFAEYNSLSGNNQQAITFGEKAIDYCLSKGKMQLAADLYLGQEVYYDILGNYASSLKTAQQALVLYEELEDSLGIATCLNDMGIVHYYLGSYDKALEYLEESLKVHVLINDSSGIGNCYNNIANIYGDQGHLEESLDWYFKGYEIDKAIGKEYGQSITLSNVGETYTMLGNYDLAEKYLMESLVLAEKTQDPWALSNPLRVLSQLFLAKEDYGKAVDYAKRSVLLTDSIGAISELSESYTTLYTIYKSQNDYKKALYYYELKEILEDSIFNTENAAIINELEGKYQSDKKNAQIQLLQTQNEINKYKVKEEQDQRNRQTIYIIVGSAVFIIIILIVFWSLMIHRKANASLQKQKEIIEDKNQSLNTALGQIEEKNKEITDSINYAKRIQAAILPSDESVHNLLPDCFILYKPKDIVAGDFYWLETINSSVETQTTQHNNILFSVADCTGHGVPGAMVSVVCNNSLNRAIQEFNLCDTNHILDKADELVIERFSRRDQQVRDGMDIALCRLDPEKLTLQFSGANNPVWIVTNNLDFYLNQFPDNKQLSTYVTSNGLSLFEIKGDKQPIGLFAHKKEFSAHSVKLIKGDTIYLLSDGYADQFGGVKGKKFKQHNLKQLLLEISDQPMQIQEILLNKHFEQWKGNIEQIDDVCVIGVRI